MSFLHKRAHLSALKLGREMLERVPAMTPARFDLLHLIYDNRKNRDGYRKDSDSERFAPRMLQTTARARLGLTRQTVHKMVERLVELGLLRKEPHPYLKRRVCLEITDEGIDRIRRAYGVAFTERYPVPPAEGGCYAPRHVYRLIREDAELEDRCAKIFASVKYQYYPPHLDKLYFGSRAPKKIGREVAKVFTAFAWKKSGPQRVGKRARQLTMLRTMVGYARELADALGDTSTLIYPLTPTADRTAERRVHPSATYRPPPRPRRRRRSKTPRP